MSNKSKKNNKNQIVSSLVNFTNPLCVPASIYFSVEINSQEHYFESINKIQDNILEIHEMLVNSKIVPKYFDIVAFNNVFDLKSLIAPLNLEVRHDKIHVSVDEIDNEYQINYANFIFEKIMSNNIANELVQLKQKNNFPLLVNALNSPEIKNNFFTLDLEGEDFNLCPFDYQFPQTCVFSLPFLILGNKKPIENYTEKLDMGLDFDNDTEMAFEINLEEVLNSDNVCLYSFDLLNNAQSYAGVLDEAKFNHDIDNALTLQENTIVYYNKFPVFITLDETKQIEIRLPFLTFDMHSAIFNSVTEYFEPELEYARYTAQRIEIAELIDNLGLEYQYVLGQRIDFIHEPEMKKNVINKIKNRDLILNNIYMEESDHHAQGAQEEATCMSMAMVETLEDPIIILTMQGEDYIIKQINAYILNQEHGIEEEMETISEYFYNWGNKDLDHVFINEIVEMSYCDYHLKLNGAVV